MLLGLHLKIFKIRLLKTLYEGELRGPQSNLFHSIIVDGKQEFLKNL